MQLNFKSYGQGPALIILHGLFGSLDNWVSHARVLSEDYSVFLLDQRNHGKSPHAPEFSYEIMAQDLLEFMDDQGIYTAHLLGHSMGGKTVMQFAADNPDRIDKLIVADMSPKAYPPHHTVILETLINFDLSQMGSRKEADAYMAERINDISVRQFLLKSLARDKEAGFSWKFNLPVIYKAYEEILSAVELEYSFDNPTLFVSGGKSEHVQEADHELIQSYFSEVEFKVIKEAGHWLHAEAPAAFLEIVKEFLGE